MSTLNLLYKRSYRVDEHIEIMIPSVGKILDGNEDDYNDIVYILTAMPIDMMVELDDAGIDFSTINEWDLFIMLFHTLQSRDTSLVFGDLDLGKFTLAARGDNVVLYDPVTGAEINRGTHTHIASALRKINNLEKNNKKPGNEAAKKYMIERARIKKNRRRNKKHDSQLEELIVAMVNSKEYKYDFEGTKNLTIYQFNESVRQVIKRVDYDNRMRGIFAGTVSAKDFSQDDLNWLTHK